MSKIKVLIISYYWPPSGGAGVQRWLKFSNYLHEQNFSITVYTPKNPENPVTDNSLLQEVNNEINVLTQPIWEPYNWYKKFIGHKKSDKINTGFLSEKKKPKWAERISIWIRGNLFIPDARCFWINPSVKYLEKYLKENPIDVIISTGPPHSMHLIALKLKRKLNVKWIADFRDPWTGIDYYQDLMLTKRAHNKHVRMEREVLTSADRIVVIGEQMKVEFGESFKHKIEVIHNGYDDKDIPKTVMRNNDRFTLMHVGSLVPSRNPLLLWETLASICNANPIFRDKLAIHLVGKTDVSVIHAIEKFGLKANLIQTDYLPHKEVLQLASSASVLLLLLNNTPNAKGILTGKMFEYLALSKPILSIGPVDGDAAAIINECKAGVTVDFDDGANLKLELEKYYDLYKEKKLFIETSNARAYSRKALTGKLASVIHKMLN
ncbi:MAG TPA: glycosyltransferase [Bacteroidia bacterium]|nr:glycosyltransferase [Bacteroidia bacterium]HNT80375.1 glycosyltransferase [Bacteroidia bacterium]